MPTAVIVATYHPGGVQRPGIHPDYVNHTHVIMGRPYRSLMRLLFTQGVDGPPSSITEFINNFNNNERKNRIEQQIGGPLPPLTFEDLELSPGYNGNTTIGLDNEALKNYLQCRLIIFINNNAPAPADPEQPRGTDRGLHVIKDTNSDRIIFAGNYDTDITIQLAQGGFTGNLCLGGLREFWEESLLDPRGATNIRRYPHDVISLQLTHAQYLQLHNIWDINNAEDRNIRAKSEWFRCGAIPYVLLDDHYNNQAEHNIGVGGNHFRMRWQYDGERRIYINAPAAAPGIYNFYRDKFKIGPEGNAVQWKIGYRTTSDSNVWNRATQVCNAIQANQAAHVFGGNVCAAAEVAAMPVPFSASPCNIPPPPPPPPPPVPVVAPIGNGDNEGSGNEGSGNVVVGATGELNSNSQNFSIAMENYSRSLKENSVPVITRSNNIPGGGTGAPGGGTGAPALPSERDIAEGDLITKINSLARNFLTGPNRLKKSKKNELNAARAEYRKLTDKNYFTRQLKMANEETVINNTAPAEGGGIWVPSWKRGSGSIPAPASAPAESSGVYLPPWKRGKGGRRSTVRRKATRKAHKATHRSRKSRRTHRSRK